MHSLVSNSVYATVRSQAELALCGVMSVENMKLLKICSIFNK